MGTQRELVDILKKNLKINKILKCIFITYKKMATITIIKDIKSDTNLGISKAGICKWEMIR